MQFNIHMAYTGCKNRMVKWNKIRTLCVDLKPTKRRSTCTATLMVMRPTNYRYRIIILINNFFFFFLIRIPLFMFGTLVHWWIENNTIFHDRNIWSNAATGNGKGKIWMPYYCTSRLQYLSSRVVFTFYFNRAPSRSRGQVASGRID